MDIVGASVFRHPHPYRDQCQPFSGALRLMKRKGWRLQADPTWNEQRLDAGKQGMKAAEGHRNAFLPVGRGISGDAARADR